jgi:hypothetical protein
MTKVIKITEHYRKKGKWNSSFSKVPKLTMSGNWLADAGFTPATMVRVECREGKLVVTAIE